ncbi:MAG: NAD-binding protein, partial [Bacteroidota bacterium]
VKGDVGYTKQAFIEFGKILLIGFSFGISGGYALYFAIKKKLIPHYLLNVVSLSVVLLIFVESDVFAHESGLLSVVVMGMFLGNRDLPNLKELLYFKESLSVLLISILFILLSANITLEDLMLVANYKTAILFAIIIFLVRPVGVFLSTIGSSLKVNEKMFISWVGPRGIVAAGIASLFGTKLAAKGVPGAEYITPLVFAVVLVTVLLNATTARYFARIVGVFLKKSEGILIIGASEFPRLIGQYLTENGRHVVLIDSNQSNIKEAVSLGMEAFTADIYSSTLIDNVELSDVGYLLSLTGNSEINKYAINKYEKQFGENGAYRLITAEEMQDPNNNSEQGLFSHVDDFASVSKVAQQFPFIRELDLDNKEHYERLMDYTDTIKDSIPLFLKEKGGELRIISSYNKKVADDISKGFKLVYLGKPLVPSTNSQK